MTDKYRNREVLFNHVNGTDFVTLYSYQENNNVGIDGEHLQAYHPCIKFCQVHAQINVFFL